MFSSLPLGERKGGQRTMAIETVASAKGSPRILSILIVLIPPVLRPFMSIPPFILRRDGECSDPYDGIGNIGVETGGSWVLCRNYRRQD